MPRIGHPLFERGRTDLLDEEVQFLKESGVAYVLATPDYYDHIRGLLGDRPFARLILDLDRTAIYEITFDER